ncbi:MAG: DUF29 domain-containing protein [Symploca sp. SIO3E6]|nr:DUF29 domain-containing protein [Caldora sp. SIO3E6]
MMTIKALYEQDFQQWIEQTIEQLQNSDFSSLDIEHLIEELTDLGKSEKRALKSNLMVLLAHLLKLNIQHDAPETMKSSWYNSVLEHRKRVLVDLEDTPSLKPYLTTAIEQAYPNARDLAIAQSQLAKFGVRVPKEKEYPIVCPFTIEQILDEEFYG